MGTYVHGHCPYGCGETLALDDEHRVICTAADCPNRTRVDELLADTETDHIVLIGRDGWSIAHPLREHADDVQACPLHRHLTTRRDAAPQTPGRYRVRPNGPTWSWHALWTNITNNLETA